MNKKQVFALVKRVLCVLLLILSLVMTIRTAWTVSTTLMDSDTSSELVLSEKLAREGGIMSDSWVYSTELQVIDCQIIYSLLFRLTPDWSLVRFWGSVIMDLMLLGVLGYLFRQARIPFNRFCLAGAALMLPFSIPYGRIVLFHNYYSFQIAFSFLIVGLYLGAARRLEAWKRWPFWAVTAGLAAAAFATGLGGVRHLMICILPLTVTAVLTALHSEKNGEQGARLRQEAPRVLLALVPLAFAGIGYLVNLNVLANQYTFKDYSTQTISLGNFGDLHTVLISLFADLGFQNSQPLFSLEGLLGISGVVAWILSLFLAGHTLRRSEEPMARFLSLFWFIVQLVMTCVFLFLTSEEMLHMLYLLPIMIWILPALGAADVRKDYGVETAEAEKPARRGKRAAKKQFAFLAGDAPVSVHGALALLACALLLANGVLYTGFFRDTSSSKAEYTGLQYNDTDTVKGLQPVADYLKENGYTLIYASYWDAAVLTELTDGQARSVPVQTGTRKHPIKYMTWLSDMNLWKPEYAARQKVAVVANVDLYYSMQDNEKLEATEVASFGAYTIFELVNPAALAEDLA